MRRALLALMVAGLIAAPGARAGVLAFSKEDCSLPMEKSSPNPCPYTIWVSSEDGTSAVRVTDGSAPGEETYGGDWDPSWAPDGRSLVFSRTMFMPDLAERFAGVNRGTVLWVSAADGSGQRRLVSPADSEHVPFQRSPEWTADGSRIVFDGVGADGLGAAYSVAADGTDLRRVSPEGEEALFASTTPEGDVTYLTSAPSCSAAARRMGSSRRSGGRIRPARGASASCSAT